MRLCDGGGGKPDGRGAAPDQQALACLAAAGPEQRAPRRLQHLRQRAERLPGQVGTHRLDLRRRHAGILGVASVELATHAAHGRGDGLTFAELAAGRRRDHADRLDAQDAREHHVRATGPVG